MRVLVCGGRNFENWQKLYRDLDSLHQQKPITLIIQGGARGADHLAKAWAIARYIPSVTFNADWATHGNAAGPIRNKLMLETSQPDFVVAFEGGKGTAHMINLARAQGYHVLMV